MSASPPSPVIRLGVLTVLLLTAGCVSAPRLGQKPVPLAAGDVAAARSLPASAEAGWPGDGWWTTFGDPQLDALIEEGLNNSPDVAAAGARFRKAGGLALEAGAALLPTLDASGKAGYERQSLNNGFPDEFKQYLPHGWHENGQIAGSLNFDIDLWGRNRAALAAATSEARAAAIDTHQAQLMLTTGIASAYADLLRLFEERDVRQAALDIRTATQKLVADRMANGLETRGSLRQSEAEVATARSNLGAAEEAIALRRNQVAALLGAGPDRGLSISRPVLSTPASGRLPEGVTTDLVGRRPDIAAARERAEAAARRIGVARADFFPAINLSALYGLQSLGLENLFEKDSRFGSAGPAISLPIFHGGALRGRYRSARADYDEAVADYDRTVLTAYQQVADAVTSQRLVSQQLDDARAALAASQEAYTIARSRYQGGLSSHLDVLAVEDRLLQARLAVAGLEASARNLNIALVRALGGGFDVAADKFAKDSSHG